MNEVEYKGAVQGIVMAARLITQYDLQEILQAISRAKAVGPIFHPTLYREKNKAMEEDEALIKAALPLWKFANEHFK